MVQRLLLIFLIIFVRDSSCLIDTLYHIAIEVQKFYSLLDKADFHNIGSPTEIAVNPSYLRMETQIRKISRQFNEMESSINSKVIPSLGNILQSSPLVIRSLDTINLYITSIDSEYRKFGDYISNDQLEELTKSVFPNIIPNILMIREIMTDLRRFVPNERSLVAVITHTASIKAHETCGTSQLISEVLIQIFRIVMIAEIKSYVMMGFSNKYLYMKKDYYFDKTGWTGINSVTSSEFQKYFASYVNILTENLEAAENLYLRACNPANGNWTRNENYFELEGTVRAMIFRYSLENCLSQTCDKIGFGVSRKCRATYYEHRDECSNVPTDCINLGSVKACTTLKLPRRLQYINSVVIGFIGNDSQCSGDNSILLNDEWDPRDISSSCSCDCYGNSSKISLSITKSRVELNKVITGLRFTRKNNILHIQVRDGLLGANGYINPATNKWRAIPDFIDSSEIHSIDRENKIFFLDDLRLPSEYVLTGIQFTKTIRDTVSGFEIGIFGVPFNYATGELSFQDGIRLFMPTDVQSQPLSFEPMNSVGTILPHEPSSENLKYIELQRSFLRDDFGQSTLPLFDAVPVKTDPPSVLNGVGIFHKSLSGHAGFISLKVYGIKHKNYFNHFKTAHIIDEKVMLD